MRLTFVKVISLITYCITCLNVNAQNISAIELQDEKNAVFRKIAWVSGDKFCVISDRYGDYKFIHFVSVYDTSGRLTCSMEKIRTEYSCQSDNIFSLGQSLFMMDDAADSYGNHLFYLSYFKAGSNPIIAKDQAVFKIKHAQEKEKLNTSGYSFKVYTGEAKKRAMVAYNNDYAGEIKEGFRFKFIDDSANISEERNLALPYNDRLCNIMEVIYDDVNEKVIMLCELYEQADNKENRKFKNSFLGIFDLSTNSYKQLDSIPDFSKSKVQYAWDNHFLSLSSIVPLEREKTGWRASFLKIDILNKEVVKQFSDTITTQLISNFFDDDRGIGKDLIHPLGLFDLGEDKYSIGWNYFFSIEQINKAQTSNIGAYVGASLAVSLLTGMTVIMIPKETNYHSFKKSLWLDLNLKSRTMEGRVIKNRLKDANYSMHSIDAFYSGNKLWQVFNYPTDHNRQRTNTCVINSNGDAFPVCDKELSEKFLRKHINSFFPGSGLRYGNKLFYLGAYDPFNDPTTDNNGDGYLEDFKLMLIKID